MAKKAISTKEDNVILERSIENKNLAKVSIVGIGMKTHAGVARKCLKRFHKKTSISMLFQLQK